MILSHPEHMRKCLKVEYLGRIEYDFQKSRVTGPWDHKDSVSEYFKKFHACVPLITGVGRNNLADVCSTSLQDVQLRETVL